MRLQSKLLFLITPLIVASLLILGSYAYIIEYNAVQENTVLRVLATIEQLNIKLVGRINAAKANASLLAGSESIKDYLVSEDKDVRNQLIKNRITNLFNKYKSTYPYYDSIKLILDDGTELIDLSSNLAEVNFSKTAWIESIRSDTKANQITSLLESSNHASKVVAITHRVPLDISETSIEKDVINAAYIVLLVQLDLIEQAKSNLVNVDMPLLIMFDHERRVISVSHSNLIPWRTSPKEISSMKLAANQRKMTNININNKSFKALAKQTELGLVVAALVPSLELHNIDVNMAKHIILIILISLLITFTSIYYGFQKIVLNPLLNIKLAARTFGTGNFQIPLVMNRRTDEIGVLASSLEKMRRHLSESQNETKLIVNQDALTGLPNRRSIMERLDIEIEHCRRNKDSKFALMFIDLDNFKGINDSMGHKAGDRMVIKVAQRLVETVRAYDCIGIIQSNENFESESNNNFVARLGGDEFLMILNDINDTECVARIAERIYALFKEPLFIDEVQLHVGMSIGIVIYPENGETPEQLIKYADIAMYSAKNSGKNQYRYYDASMDTSARKSLEIEGELRKALSENSLELFYQPQFDLKTQELIGSEALIRWHHKERGWISPAEFIPIAESCGLIHELGNWVLTAACQQLRDWVDRNIQIPCVSINLSSHQVASEGLSERIHDLIINLKLEPSMLEFELTETAIFKNREVVTHNLENIRKTGARLALDDFGTGFSSLAWVQYCTVDVIKIDRSFVTDLSSEPKHKAVIASVVELCRHLNIATVAEGIESLDEAEMLCEMGCDVAQGYYFSRPLSVSDLEEFIDNYQSKPLKVKNR